MELLDQALEIKEELVAIRRHLHQYPELSGMEFETGKFICSKLDEWGIPYEYGIADTGVVAIIRGNRHPETDHHMPGTLISPRKVVALRADIDALSMTELSGLTFASCREGVAHTCGHDGHTAVALGAAKLLKDMEESLAGDVKIFFQPAEETTGGAERMIRQGCMENPRVHHVLGLHMDPTLPCGDVEFKYGKMMASSDEFTIILEGQGCHGAHPERGCDTIAMAAQIITSLQTIVSRNVSPVNSAVVTVGMIHAGTAGNAIAQKAELTGIMRCLDPETREFLRRRIREIVENTANAFGGCGELILRPSYSALINDDATVNTVIACAEDILGKDHIHMMAYPDMGTEDFSFFARECPSCYWHLGCGNKKDIQNNTVRDIHNPGFVMDEDCLPIGVAIQTAAILRLLG